MISRNISVYAILFMTANQALLLIVYQFYCCPVYYFAMVQVRTYYYLCRSDFWSNSEAENPMEKEWMFGEFLCTKSFVCNQHLNPYWPRARHQFLIPTVTWTNTQQQQQRVTSKKQGHHDLPWPPASSGLIWNFSMITLRCAMVHFLLILQLSTGRCRACLLWKGQFCSEFLCVFIWLLCRIDTH